MAINLTAVKLTAILGKMLYKSKKMEGFFWGHIQFGMESQSFFGRLCMESQSFFSEICMESQNLMQNGV